MDFIPDDDNDIFGEENNDSSDKFTYKAVPLNIRKIKEILSGKFLLPDSFYHLNPVKYYFDHFHATKEYTLNSSTHIPIALYSFLKSAKFNHLSEEEIIKIYAAYSVVKHSIDDMLYTSFIIESNTSIIISKQTDRFVFTFCLPDDNYAFDPFFHITDSILNEIIKVKHYELLKDIDNLIAILAKNNIISDIKYFDKLKEVVYHPRCFVFDNPSDIEKYYEYLLSFQNMIMSKVYDDRNTFSLKMFSIVFQNNPEAFEILEEALMYGFLENQKEKDIDDSKLNASASASSLLDLVYSI